MPGVGCVLPLKAVEEDGVTFHLEVRKFDGHGPFCGQIGGALNRGHAAGGHPAVDPVMIEPLAGMKGNQLCWGKRPYTPIGWPEA
jgi:hypothetical protein